MQSSNSGGFGAQHERPRKTGRLYRGGGTRPGCARAAHNNIDHAGKGLPRAEPSLCLIDTASSEDSMPATDLQDTPAAALTGKVVCIEDEPINLAIVEDLL